MPTTKTETLNVRISDELKIALTAAAHAEHRTISNLIEYLIICHCRKTGTLPSTPKCPEPK
jgi:uncharacterized protein (DUF1778 family)